MRHFLILAALCLCLPFSLSALKYNGSTLAENNSFTHALLCNTPSDVQEVSGLACSRLTPGYLWTVGDDDSHIYALDMQGRKCLSLTLQGKQKRDWEDICIASINGIPHLMIGAFGDNDLVYANNYHIYVFPEPAIAAYSGSTPTLSVADYVEETQGESFAWNISGTAFYTTSDEKNASPIYLYTDTSITTDLDTPLSNLAGQKMLLNGRLFIFLNGHFYDLLGNHYESL